MVLSQVGLRKRLEPNNLSTADLFFSLLISSLIYPILYNYYLFSFHVLLYNCLDSLCAFFVAFSPEIGGALTVLFNHTSSPVVLLAGYEILPFFH